jgi:PAS domain S-box-containing protein
MNAKVLPAPFTRNAALSAVLLLVLAVTFWFYVRRELAVDSANAVRFNSLLLGEQLRQTSNDLTRMARGYTVTRDTVYRREYQRILDIREGTVPRPRNYTGNEWDLAPESDAAKAAEEQRPVALLTLMRGAGFTEKEFSKLAAAQAISDSLAQTDLLAMQLADSTGPGGTATRSRAINMLYSASYHNTKATIMKLIGDFMLDVDQRTLIAVERAKTMANVMRFLFAGVGLALWFMLWRTYSALRKTMGGSVKDVYRQIATLGGTEFTGVNAPGSTDGNVLGWLSEAHGKLIDVNRARAASEERMRAVVESALDCIVSMSADGRIIEFNPAAEQTFGYKRDDVIGRKLSELIIPPAHREAHERGVERFLATGTSRIMGRRVELLALRADGSEILVELAVTALGPHTNPVFTGFLRDISDRRRHEEKLREQASLLDRAQDAIIVRDLDHRVTYWNKSAERLYGWSAAEATGSVVSALLFKDPTAFRAASSKLLKTGEWVGELEKIGKAGKRLTIEGRWTLVRDAAGEPSGIMAIDTDITERKNLEQQFLRAQRMESIGTLAGGIAHDLNNVLAPIMMSIDLLKQTVSSSDDIELLDSIAASSRRAADMVAQLLSFARGMDGRRVPIRAKHLIGDIEKIVGDTFDKNIEIRTLVKPDLWTVIGDPTQLHQVMLNLAVNSRDAMPHGGQISITAENLMLDEEDVSSSGSAPAGPYILIEVEDTGNGIAPDAIERIFDPFFTTKEFGKGTGLGLSTSLGIVRSHGGFMRVYSEVGKGTRFRIYLPAQTEEQGAEAPAPPLELERGNGETVLVVDDEASIRQITGQTLEAFGYKVLLAGDGAEAIAIYAEHQKSIAVVLTDIMMPVLDGQATIQVLRRINPRIRIIVASGIAANRGMATDAAKAVKHYLAKPYTAVTLLTTLRKVLRER